MRELAAGDRLRQYHVGEQQVDFVPACGPECQCLMSVGRGKNVVAERAKGCAHEFAEHLFILHQKNSDVSRRCGRNRGLGWLDGDFRRWILEDAITDGQISANYRSVA